MIPHYLYYVAPTIIVLIGIRKYRSSKWGKCKNNKRLDGKLAIVTGANCGLGFEIARELANRGANVILACRNVKAGEEAIAIIKKQSKNNKSNQECIELDLASIKSIDKFVDIIKSKYNQIDILVNNAGVSFPDKAMAKTLDGFEIHFGINHLGHFHLTNCLLELIRKSDYKRVVILSSMIHEKGNIILDDLNLEKKENQKRGYANSKLANYYFSKELASRHVDLNVYAACPGWVYTSLFRNYRLKMLLGIVILLPTAFLFMRTPRQGMQTPMYCITENNLENGEIYRDCQRFKTKHQFDKNVSERLWEKSEAIIIEAKKKLQ